MFCSEQFDSWNGWGRGIIVLMWTLGAQGLMDD